MPYYNSSNSAVTALVCVALVIAIIIGLGIISEHVSCFNFFGLARGCVTH